MAPPTPHSLRRLIFLGALCALLALTTSCQTQKTDEELSQNANQNSDEGVGNNDSRAIQNEEAHSETRERRPLSAASIYLNSIEAVVTVLLLDHEDIILGIGSGFVLGNSGMVVTNRHVIDHPKAASAKVLLEEKVYTIDYIFSWDEDRDLAALKFDFPIGQDRYENLELELNSPTIGEDVLAIGSPAKGGLNSMTKGIISNLFDDDNGRLEMIQTDAAINPGNSGGPLINMEGRVVGVNTIRPERTEGGRNIIGIGYAIPAREVQSLLFLNNPRPFGQ